MKTVILLNLIRKANMKNIIIYLILTLAISSCTEDKGNYDYSELNEVMISEMDDYYQVLTEGSLNIEPSIDFTLQDNESKLEYGWFIYKINDNHSNIDTLSLDKSLDVETIFVPKGNYKLRFKVTDNSQNIFWEKTADLKVSGFPDGLQVLSNVNDNAQFSVIRGQINDWEAYKKVNETSAGTNPVKISGYNEVWAGTDNEIYQFIIACNDANGGVMTDNTYLKKQENLKDLINANLAVPTNYTGFYGTVGWQIGFLWLYAGDQVYLSYKPDSRSPVDFFKAHERKLNPNTLLLSTAGYINMYSIDQTTTGFVNIDSWGYTIIDCTNEEGSAFDVSNTGLKAIVGKTIGGSGANGFVLSEDETNHDKYILEVSYNGNTVLGVNKDLIEEEIIKTATHFELLNTKKVLLFSNEENIYTYDISAKKILYTFSYPKGELIDHFEVSSDDKKLYVGTSNGTNQKDKGNVYVYKLDPDGEVKDVLESYKNKVGRVVDFNENY